MTAPGPEPRWLGPVLVATLSLGVTAGFTRFTFNLVLPELDPDVLGSYSGAGLLVGLNLATYLATIVGTRRWWRGDDPARLIRAGVACGGAGAALMSVAGSVPVLAVAMVLLGVSGGGGFVPVTTLMAALVPPARRGLAAGVLLGGVGLSVVLTGRLVALAHAWAPDATWALVWRGVAGLAAAVWVLCRWRLPVVPVGDDTAPAARVRWERGALPGGVAVAACYALVGITSSTYISYLAPALTDDHGLSEGHTSALASLLGVAMVGGVAVGRLSDRLGRRATLAGGFALSAACSALLLVGREPWLAVSVVLMGLLTTGGGAVVGAYLVDHLPAAAVGSYMGVLTLAIAGAQLVGPPIGGILAEATSSFATTYAALALLAGAGAVVATRLDPVRPPPSAPPLLGAPGMANVVKTSSRHP